MYNTKSVLGLTPVICQLESVHLQRIVEIELFYPSGLLGNEKLNLLLLNDGQDAAGLNLQETLSSLYEDKKIEPVVVAAIKASADRLQEYGVAGVLDFAARGSKADAYSKFITLELMPFLENETGMPFLGKRAFAGCSLGGLTAFDIVWKNDTFFDIAGVFSGSFWWRKKDLKDGYTDDDRIMHQVIRDTEGQPAVKFWLMTGTEDETADRNRNFIIDSIDDTIDIIKELTKKGYKRQDDIFYYEMVGGKHNVATWGKALPSFLCWAFPRKTFL
ncbi:alpha/beta hydrolase [Pedobacter cryoconitis]|uniref:Enterochelin esterase-like enzyme n=1 Tax=Pedobacter cryoconitis TaxID=188932 RepID=A0A327SDC3_9SPHI|nr:alpha/beta hydrolase-fold protein [Pedobacter cryoconitis]RAJ27086.1 enterochelin esterase-like enzyme [Pedobacter cryoconitis]